MSRPWLRGLRWRAVHWGWEAAQRAGKVTADTPAARRFAEFGAKSTIAFPPGTIFGERWIAIGAETIIGALVTMSAGLVPGHDLGPEPVLRIGDRCVIGRGSHVVAHHGLVIGDDVFTGPYVYITDQNHGYADPEVPIGRQMPRNAPVWIGSGSWLGAGTVVLPGTHIGRNVVIAAGSVVRGTVPDRCVAAGVPARVIREYVPGTGWWPHPKPLPDPPAARPAPPDPTVAAGLAVPPGTAVAAGLAVPPGTAVAAGLAVPPGTAVAAGLPVPPGTAAPVTLPIMPGPPLPPEVTPVSQGTFGVPGTNASAVTDAQ